MWLIFNSAVIENSLLKLTPQEREKSSKLIPTEEQRNLLKHFHLRPFPDQAPDQRVFPLKRSNSNGV